METKVMGQNLMRMIAVVTVTGVWGIAQAIGQDDAAPPSAPSPEPAAVGSDFDLSTVPLAGERPVDAPVGEAPEPAMTAPTAELPVAAPLRTTEPPAWDNGQTREADTYRYVGAGTNGAVATGRLVRPTAAFFEPQPLNRVARLLCMRAGVSYASSPLVQGEVTGVFYSADPMDNLRVIAQAHGYDLEIRGSGPSRIARLINDEIRATSPMVDYVRELKYLRAPYVRDPGLEGVSFGGPDGDNGSQDTARPSSVPGSQAERLENLLLPLVLDPAGKGGGFVRYDPKTHTVFARGRQHHIAMLDAVLDRLDAQQPNIRIRVWVYALRSGSGRFRGLDYSRILGSDGLAINTDLAATIVGALTHAPAESFFGGAPPIEGFEGRPPFLFDPQQLSVVLRFLSDENLAELRAHWEVLTEENEFSRLARVQKEPIVQITAATAESIAQVQFDYIDIGQILSVTATRLPQRTDIVRCQFRLELSEIIGRISAGDSSAPVYRQEDTERIVMAPIGAATVISGLNTLVNSNIRNKIPILGDLPLLGWLFGSRQSTKDKQALVVVILPSLVWPEPCQVAEMHREVIDTFKWNKASSAPSPEHANSTAAQDLFGEIAKPNEPVSPLSPPPRR